jgi:hypothetical protein
LATTTKDTKNGEGLSLRNSLVFLRVLHVLGVNLGHPQSTHV